MNSVFEFKSHYSSERFEVSIVSNEIEKEERKEEGTCA